MTHWQNMIKRMFYSSKKNVAPWEEWLMGEHLLMRKYQILYTVWEFSGHTGMEGILPIVLHHRSVFDKR